MISIVPPFWEHTWTSSLFRSLLPLTVSSTRSAIAKDNPLRIYEAPAKLFVSQHESAKDGRQPYREMPRRQHITLLTLIGGAAFLAIFFVSVFRNKAGGTRHSDYIPSYQESRVGLNLNEGILHGEATAPKLENATLKFVLRALKRFCRTDLFAEQS